MEASIDQRFDRDRLFLRPLGEWVIDEAARLDRKLRDLMAGIPAERARRLVIDLSAVESLDTAGVYLLARVERRGVEAAAAVDWTGAGRARAALIERVRRPSPRTKSQRRIDGQAAGGCRRHRVLHPTTTAARAHAGGAVRSLGCGARRARFAAPPWPADGSVPGPGAHRV
jgi:ABC-type transporter Mla MlaB component